MRRPRIKPPELTIDREESHRLCDYPGCAQVAEHRAPKARDRSSEYYWFCLEHARVYNEAWDYYTGMSPNEIDASRRDDGLWNRPTWPFGAPKHPHESAAFMDSQNAAFRQAFDFFHHEPDPTHAGTAYTHPPETPERQAERQEIRAAMAVLGIDGSNIDADTIKQRYKELAKRYHPDQRGGDNSTEDKLKTINQAYTVLKKYGSA
jgi:hypothetical protein